MLKHGHHVGRQGQQTRAATHPTHMSDGVGSPIPGPSPNVISAINNNEQLNNLQSIDGSSSDVGAYLPIPNSGMKMPPFIGGVGANSGNSDASNFGQIPGNTAFFSQF